MTRDMKYLPPVLPQKKLPFLQVKIGLSGRDRKAHPLVKLIPVLPQVTLLLPVEGNQDVLSAQELYALVMVRVEVGGDDQGEVLQRDPVPLYLGEQPRNVLQVPHIHQGEHLPAEKIGVAVVLVQTEPRVEVYPLDELHALYPIT